MARPFVCVCVWGKLLIIRPRWLSWADVLIFTKPYRCFLLRAREDLLLYKTESDHLFPSSNFPKMIIRGKKRRRGCEALEWRKRTEIVSVHQMRWDFCEKWQFSMNETHMPNEKKRYFLVSFSPLRCGVVGNTRKHMIEIWKSIVHLVQYPHTAHPNRTSTHQSSCGVVVNSWKYAFEYFSFSQWIQSDPVWGSGSVASSRWNHMNSLSI